MLHGRLIILFALTVWLANYMVCFCCAAHSCHNQTMCASEALPDDHSDQEEDNSQDAFPHCFHCSCDLQMFTPIEKEFASNQDLPPFLLYMAHSIFLEQILLNSIYHPPEA